MTANRGPVWVSPLPPLPSGIGQYSADLLGATSDAWGIAVLPEPGSKWSGGTHQPIRFKDVQPNDRLVLQLGNSEYHEYAFKLATRGGSILVLHDVVLHHARLAQFVRKGQSKRYIRLMTALYGTEGASHAGEVLRGSSIDIDRFPLSEDLIRRASRVVVHSDHARRRLETLVPESDVSVVPMGVPLPAIIDWRRARRHFGIREDIFLMTSITHVNPMKRMPIVLRAFRRLLERVPQARFIIAGSVSAGVQLERQIELLGLRSHVRLLGYLDDNDARILARAGDVSVNLRYPSTGETSASLLRLMAASVPVIVSKHGSALELPEGTAIHLPVDRLEEETLTEYLLWLASDREAREQIGVAGRRFVEQRHSMGAAVDGYRSVIRDAWGVELPGLVQPLVEEPAPQIVDQRVSTMHHQTDPPLLVSIATSLHALGLGDHDGTIEKIAGRISDLGLDTENTLSNTSEGSKPTIDPELLEILACPVCKTRVRLDSDKLVCDSCGREYRIENGIPVMLVDEDVTG